MVTTTALGSLAEIAAHLRLAIVRTARRLRQEAFEAEGRGELSPTPDRRAGDGRAPRPADAERARRARADQAPDRDPDRRQARASSGSSRRTADPSDGRAFLVATTAEGRGAAAAPAHAQERLSRQAAARPRPRRGRDARAGRGDPRAAARRGSVAVSAALRRSFSSLQIPNYRRYFAGQIVSLSGNWMQMVAEMWLILELTGSGVAVGVTSALQFLPMLLFGAWGGVLADRWPKRSLLIVTQTAMARPGARALGADRDRRGRALDGVRARLRPRRGQLGRQPDPAELRDRDGRLRPGRQRGRPQQRPRSTRRGSSARRAPGS